MKVNGCDENDFCFKENCNLRQVETGFDLLNEDVNDTKKGNTTTSVLYKYRSLENFEFFVDIIINKRLYAAHYKDLNDPMEANYFVLGKPNNAIRESLFDQKGKLRVCSLSMEKDNELLWAHYANGHRGVVIGVQNIQADRNSIVPVRYSGLPYIEHRNIENPIAEIARFILTHKTQIWCYEKEVRVFSNDNFINIDLACILVGKRTSTQNYDFIKDLVEKHCPNLIENKSKRTFELENLQSNHF